MKKLKQAVLLGLSASVLLLSGCQSETEYPNKDVSVIIGFNVGGGIDVSGRAIFTEIDEQYDIAFVPTNVTGASGTIGATELLNSDPDGYTLMVAGTGLNAAHVAMGYENTFEDFQPIAQYATAEAGLYVNANSPYQTYEDLINAARENPGEIKMGVQNGTINHYGSLAIEQHEGVDFQDVPVGGDQPVPPELLANRIDAYVVGVHQNKAYIESGDFKCLGVFAEERVSSIPDTPTFAELGYTSNYGLSFGIWAPAETPDEIVSELSKAVETSLQNEEFVADLAVLGYTAAYLDTNDYEAYLRQNLTDVINLNNILNAGGDAANLDPYVGAYGFPIVIGSLIAILAIAEIIRKIVKKEKFAPKIIELFKGKTLYLLLCIIAYAVAFEFLGYVFSTAIFLIGSTWILQTEGKKSIVKIALISVIFTIFTFLFFTEVAGIIVPTSFLGII